LPATPRTKNRGRSTGATAAARRGSRVAPGRVLVVDIGGNNVKIALGHGTEVRKLPSGPTLTPRQMVTGVTRLARDWTYDVVSLGYPGPVAGGKPLFEPKNLGKGWVGFDYAKAFKRPVKMINDAAMQALGSYKGGRMLFLGLGTGLGVALVYKDWVEPMEIAHLAYKKGHTFEDYVGRRGLEWLGKKRWRRSVADVVAKLSYAMEADYVVLGGGNAKKLDVLPSNARLGNNDNAIVGGVRLWGINAGAAAALRRSPSKPARLAQPRRKTTAR
jgi:polyphosphate glucokinase